MWKGQNYDASAADLTSHKHIHLAAIEKKKKVNETNNGHKNLLLHGRVGVLGGFLLLLKVFMEINKVLTRRRLEI